MFVEVGKGDTSPSFDRVLELLLAKGEFLAFAPDTRETRMMINVLSFKFPLLKVYVKDPFFMFLLLGLLLHFPKMYNSFFSISIYFIFVYLFQTYSEIHHCCAS